MRRIGLELIREKKAELELLAQQGEDKDQLLGKDILSVLIKSNMQESTSGKLDDETVLAQYVIEYRYVGPNGEVAHQACLETG